jgi:hypothetical protein
LLKLQRGYCSGAHELPVDLCHLHVTPQAEKSLDAYHISANLVLKSHLHEFLSLQSHQGRIYFAAVCPCLLRASLVIGRTTSHFGFQTVNTDRWLILEGLALIFLLHHLFHTRNEGLDCFASTKWNSTAFDHSIGR